MRLGWTCGRPTDKLIPTNQPSGGGAKIPGQPNPLLRGAALLCALTTPAFAAAPTPPLATAALHAAQFCLWTGATPPPGTAVTLVIADQPQTLAHAEITGAAKTCPAPTTPALPAYTLKLTTGTVPPDEALIAIIGQPSVTLAAGQANLAQPSGAITFKSCTSSEGVHLTAWRAGTRIWHSYYAVDADLDADCAPPESNP